MSEAKDGGPAFPVTSEVAWDESRNDAMSGMTLRDYFAASAPIGVADANDAFYRQNGRNAGESEMLKMLAELRGRYADAMLAARGKS